MICFRKTYGLLGSEFLLKVLHNFLVGWFDRLFIYFLQNMVWSLQYLEEPLTRAIETLPSAVACKTYMSLYKLNLMRSNEVCGWNDVRYS